MKKIYSTVIILMCIAVGFGQAFHRTNNSSEEPNRNTTSIVNGAFADPCPTYSLPFSENFNTTQLPTCWTQYSGTNGLGTGEQWQISGSTEGFGGVGAAAKLNPEFLVSNTSEDWLVTPALDLSQTSNNHLTFYSKNFFTDNQGSTLSIRVSTTSQTDITTFSAPLEIFSELGTTYTLKSVDLSSYDAETTLYVAFVVTQSDGDVWLIDNVLIESLIVCTPPITIASDYSTTSINGGSGTATLNWTLPADASNVLVVMKKNTMVDDVDPASGTAYPANPSFGNGSPYVGSNYVVYNGTGTSVTVSNLTANTTYHVALYGYNTPGYCYNTADRLVNNFIVPCGSFNLPFNEGFELGAPPSCWTQFVGDDSIAGNEIWQSTTTYANSGAKSAIINYDDAGDTEDWLVTPPIMISSAANASLSFYTRDEDLEDYGSIYSIRISEISQTDQTTFVDLAQPPYNETDISDENGDFILHSIDLSAYNNKTVYVAFILTQNFGDSFILDDVKIEAAPTTPDMDTEVYAATPQVGEKTIIAANTTDVESAEDMFSFTIEDQGTTDGLPTNVTTMRFVPASANTADWSDTIQGVTLTSGATTLTPSTISIEDAQILLTFENPIEISNATFNNFTLGVYLNLSPIVNGSILKFQIDASASGFSADALGSGFSDPFSQGAVIGSDITIDSSTLDIQNYELNQLHIYSTKHPRTIMVKGSLNSKTTVTIYDIQGRAVLSSVLSGETNSNQIDISTVSDGIYVVKLSNDVQQKTQRVLIK